MTITNDRICPEDKIRILLTASKIPDTARVFKRSGENPYVLRRDLTLYQHGTGTEKAIQVAGLFLISDRGGITQVPETMLLLWEMTAEDMVDTLKNSWEVDQ